MWGRFSSDKVKQGDAVEPRADGFAEPAQTAVLEPPPPPEAPSVRASDVFLSMKVDLHRHLIERFNLSTLDRASREEVANEIQPLVKDFVRSGQLSAQRARDGRAGSGHGRRDAGARPDRAAAQGRHGLRHPDQHASQGLCRAPRPARRDAGAFPRRGASPEDRQQDRLGHRQACRRILSDGRRAPRRRVARQRRHQADRARRARSSRSASSRASPIRSSGWCSSARSGRR